MSPAEQLDAASLQVLISRLEGIAEEMGAVLQRSAYSPNIKERADCSAAVFTASGELLAQAEHIPVHLGSMPASVAAVIGAVAGNELGRDDSSGRAVVGRAAGDGAAGDGAAGDRAVGDGASRGDGAAGVQYVVNDPFAGGTHLNDITLVAPCVVGGRLVGWVANRAHHADVGGSAPGSLPADAVEIFAEGLRLPPLRFTDEVRALVLANSRTPEERSGDLDAQVGANRVGVERLAELVTRLLERDASAWDGGGGRGEVVGVRPQGVDVGASGVPDVVGRWGAPERVPTFEAVLAYGERRMRAVLGEMVDGVWCFRDVLDSTGPTDEQQRPAHLEVAVTVAGESIEVNFTGTDAQRRGNVNAVEAVTVSAVAYALRVALDPSLPSNGGVLRPVSVVAPAGTLVNAQAPVAVGAGNVEVSQRIAELCLGALAGPCAGRVGAAGQGTMNNLLIGGHGDEAWVYYETVAGGQAGGPAGAGQSGVHTGMTNTRNTPIEALERAFPLRVLRYRLRQGSGGAGWSAGGEGIERDLHVLEDATVSLITERRVSQPWGLAGGESGSVGENWLLPGGDETRAERLPGKCTLRLNAGDVLRMLTPGGGGWGSPRQHP